MRIIPSIDLKDGRCVKLIGGVVGSGFTVSEDPLSLARFWMREGAELLHVIDLDGAIEGSKRNRGIIRMMLKEVPLPVEVGGGLRTVDDVVEILDAGARWAIIGTALIEEGGFLERLISEVSASKLIASIDSKGGRVALRGWTKVSALSPVEAVKAYGRFNFSAFLYTDIDVEGRQGGVNVKALREIVSATSIPIIYSGGIANLSDLVKLKSLGVYGAVVGSALYKGDFTLEEAKNAVERKED